MRQGQRRWRIPARVVGVTRSRPSRVSQSGEQEPSAWRSGSANAMPCALRSNLGHRRRYHRRVRGDKRLVSKNLHLLNDRKMAEMTTRLNWTEHLRQG